MAREVKVSIILDDDGTMRLTEKSAERVSKSLNKAGRSAQTADRRLKGAADASSNLTKNFAKTAQGAGGFVQAYATVAATAFAVSAAFQFLKTAGDFRVIQEGQIAYASTTGVALNLLTTQVRAAADGLLDFKAASEAAAIGSASGLSGDQLTKLAKGAADVAKILGRDVTDSFNRLVRGVTKAEPELLDELGITLRLEEATTSYASSIGKLRQELTINERKQAVAVDVLGQLEDKYAAVTAVIKPANNAFLELEVAFSDVLKTFKELAATFAEPIAKILTKNVFALIAVLGLIAVPILRTILPGLSTWVAKTQEASSAAAKAVEKAQKRIQKAKQEIAEFTPTTVQSRAQEAVVDLKARKGSGLESLQQGQELSQRKISAMINAAKKSQGEYSKLSAEVRSRFIADLETMKNKAVSTTQQMTLSFKNWATKTKGYITLVISKLDLYISRGKQAGAAVVAFGAKAANTFVKLSGKIGIAILIFESLKFGLQQLGFLKVNEEAEALRKTLEKSEDTIKQTIKAFEQFAEVQKRSTAIKDKEGNIIGFEVKSQNIAAGAKTVSALITALKDVKLTASEGAKELDKLTDADDYYLKVNVDISDFNVAEKAYFGYRKLVGKGLLAVSEFFGLGEEIDLGISEAGINQLKNAGALAKIIRDTVKATKLEGTEPAERLREIAIALESANKAAGTGLSSALEALKSLGDIDEDKIDDLIKQLDTLSRAEASIVETSRENEKAYDKRIASVTQFSSSLEDQIRLEEGLLSLLEKSNADDRQKNTEAAQKRLKVLRELSESERRLALFKISSAADAAEQQLTANELDSKRIPNITKIQVLEEEINKILDDQNIARNAGKIIDDKQLQLNQETVRNKMAEIALLQKRNNLEKASYTTSLKRADLDAQLIGRQIEGSTLLSGELAVEREMLEILFRFDKIRAEIMAQEHEATALQRKQLDMLGLQADLQFKLSNEKARQIRLSTENSVIEQRYAVQLAYATGLFAKRLGMAKQIEKNQAEIAYLERQRAEAQSIGSELGEAELAQADQKIKSLQAQNELLKEQQTLAYNLRQAAVSSAQAGIADSVSSLLKGEESSFTDAMLILARSVVNSVIDAFADEAASFILDKLNLFDPPEVKIRKAMEDGADNFSKEAKDKVLDPLAKTFQDGVANINTALSTSIDKLVREFGRSIIDLQTVLIDFVNNFVAACDACANSMKLAIEEACKSCKCDGGGSGGGVVDAILQTIPGPSTEAPAPEGTDRRDQVLPTGGTDSKVASDVASEKQVQALEAVAQGLEKVSAGGILVRTYELNKDAEGNDVRGKEILQPLPTKAELVEQAIGNAFPSSAPVPVKIIEDQSDTSSKTINNALKASEDSSPEADPIEGAVTKGANKFGDKFSQGTVEFMGDFAKTFKKGNMDFGSVFEKLLGGGGGGDGLASTIMSIFGFASGGIMPGGMKTYANGGIIKKPTMGMIGEGGMNEAVVPLPDGKSIPIEGNLGGGAQTNNVSVNVNVSSDGQASTQATQNDKNAGELGKAIAVAVQEELQRQKRPGGILSPYGAA